MFNAQLPPDVDSQQTIEVYRSSMAFSAESAGFVSETESLRRLGINAQIIAAHAGAGGRAVEVIVAEIGRLSLEIRESLESLSKSTRDLSQKAVGSISVSQRLITYSKAWNVGINDMNAEIFRTEWWALHQRYREEFLNLQEKLHQHEVELRSLQRGAVQIPMISSLMKIVVTEIGRKGAELSHAAIELEKFNQFLISKIERMQNNQLEASHRIQLILQGGKV